VEGQAKRLVGAMKRTQPSQLFALAPKPPLDSRLSLPQLVEDEAERLVGAMKRTVREGLGAAGLRRFLPPRLGGVESSAVMMQRLLLLREFNYEPDIMSTPDWL
jgi:hypothetical protein